MEGTPDSTALKPGSASARAHADAARAVREPSFVNAAKAHAADAANTDGAAVGGAPDPTELTPDRGDAEPEVEEQEQLEAEDQGTEETPGEDYDEESAAIYSDEGTPAGGDAAAAATTQTDSQAPTIETLSRQVAALQEQLSRGHAAESQAGDGKQPAEVPEPTHAETVERLYKEHQGFRAKVEELKARKPALEQALQEVANIRKDAETARRDAQRFSDLAEHYRERLKADPENLAFQDQIALNEQRQRAAETKADHLEVRAARLDMDTERKIAGYNQELEQVNQFGESERQRTISQRKQDVADRETYTAAQREWEAAFPAFCKRHKIPADKVVTVRTKQGPKQVKVGELVNRALLRQAIQTSGAIENVASWMDEQHDIIGMVIGLSGAAVEQYADGKRAAATIRAPQGAAAVASRTKAESRDRYDSKAADRLAQASLKKALGG